MRHVQAVVVCSVENRLFCVLVVASEEASDDRSSCYHQVPG